MMLSTTGMGKQFEGFQALTDVNLSITRHEKHAIIGPNGAGKTTLFNCITGHLKPSVGQVKFKDREIGGMAPHKIVGLGIARSFQRINIFPTLTVFENVQAALIADRGLMLNLIRRGDRLFRDETQAVLETVELVDEADQQAGLMSYGKQKQLELAIAIAAEPELLLLDEPTAGMSPQETANTIALIAQIAGKQNFTLLFTEHDMEVVFSIADRISVLHHGTLIATGTKDEVRNNPEVRRVYLGEEGDGAT